MIIKESTQEKTLKYKKCPQIFNQSPSFNDHPRIHTIENQYDYKEYENIFYFPSFMELSKKRFIEKAYEFNEWRKSVCMSDS
jgi:hypothetical protein